MEKEKNNLNPFLFPFYNIYYIFLNALNGLIFVFFRLPKIVYDLVSFRLDKTYHKFKGEINNNEQNIAKAKVKVYHYSQKYMDKLYLEKEKLNKELSSTEAVRNKEPVTYLIKAKNLEGKIISETISGYSKHEINAFLLSEGYEVYLIKTSKAIEFLYGGSTFLKPTMRVKDLIFWLTQLSTYLKAGITLSKAVKILSKQMGKKSRSKQRIFQAISYELTLGETFSNSLEKQGKMFPALLINMFKAAEATGTLEETLDDMSNYYTEIDKTRKQMISAMTYPSIISIFAICVITFIMIYVVPQFQDIYAQSDAKINNLTSLIINFSAFLQARGIYVFIGFIIIIFLFIIAYKKVKVIRTSLQSFAMHIPIVGKTIIYNEITIFTKTFASLLKNNVFITDSMTILSKITSNEIYKAIMFNTINNIIKGNKISESFKDHWAIPDVAYYMIVTGESTGELAEMMQKVSEYYQEMHRNIVNNLKNFIEPIMITGLALVVGIIILAVIIPMFSMYDQI